MGNRMEGNGWGSLDVRKGMEGRERKERKGGKGREKKGGDGMKGK